MQATQGINLHHNRLRHIQVHCRLKLIQLFDVHTGIGYSFRTIFELSGFIEMLLSNLDACRIPAARIPSTNTDFERWRQRERQRTGRQPGGPLVISVGCEEPREWASSVRRHGHTQTITNSAQALDAGVQKARVATIL